jgi:ABC-type transporter Mla subunit MlaD
MITPWPREIAQLADRGRQTLERVLALAPRAVALLDQAEALMVRVDALVDSIEATNRQARAVVGNAQKTVSAADRAVGQATALIDQLSPLVTASEPALTRLIPVLTQVADSVTPQDAAAIAQLVNDLPEIVSKLNRDILPVLDTLGTVAPDLREVLDVSKDVSEMLGAVPGLGRVKRRIEDDHEQAESTREYRADEEPPTAPNRRS